MVWPKVITLGGVYCITHQPWGQKTDLTITVLFYPGTKTLFYLLIIKIAQACINSCREMNDLVDMFFHHHGFFILKVCLIYLQPRGLINKLIFQFIT